MAWKIVDCADGNITNGDLIEIQKLLEASDNTKHIEIANKLKEFSDLAKYDKTMEAKLADDGGIILNGRH